MFSTLELDVREETKQLPSLSEQEAQKLLQILSNPSIYSPRVHADVTFQQWAALLDNPQWRRSLYQLRISSLVTTKMDAPITNIYNWFQNIFDYDRGWQSLHALNSFEAKKLTFAFRQRELVTREVSVEGIKVIDLGMELGNQSVALLLGLTAEDEQKIGIRVQLHPANGQAYLPHDIKLALISQSGTVIQEFKSRIQDNFLQLKRFTCLRGKSFRIKVSINEVSITEDFVIEATAPASYE